MAELALLERMREEMPIAVSPYAAEAGSTGLVIIDEVNGFCTVGAGNLAPPAPDDQIARMVAMTDEIALDFNGRAAPIFVFLDTHEPGKAEPPYPPHCERGTGEEELVPELKWLESCNLATLVQKDCINGFVGAIDHETGSNLFVDWTRANALSSLIVTGICTDICVMDFVLTALSARNHGLLGDVKDIVVIEPATSTYDLPRAAAESLKLPATAAHPQALTHHTGLYFMASRGAVIASTLTWTD
jgi:nicotinamidase-related amidase